MNEAGCKETNICASKSLCLEVKFKGTEQNVTGNSHHEAKLLAMQVNFERGSVFENSRF